MLSAILIPLVIMLGIFFIIGHVILDFYFLTINEYKKVWRKHNPINHNLQNAKLYKKNFLEDITDGK